MIRVLILAISLSAGPVWAQTNGQGTPAPTADDTQTYADIRADLQLLSAQIAGLRNELLTKTPQETGVFNAEPALQRLDMMEAELRQLTQDVEQLGFRIDQVVTDGTNRVGDLEFRLLELEGGDYADLKDPLPLGTTDTAATDATASVDPVATLGTGAERPLLRPSEGGGVASLDPSLNTGGGVAVAPVPQPTPPIANVQPEAADFDAALAQYRGGDYGGAARAFEAFLQTYPAGPLAGEALYWRGEALSASGDWKSAARSYLESFSGAPQGPKAPEALYSLGVSLGKLGQLREACLTLGEVRARFPTADPDLSARTASEMTLLSCS